MTGYRDRIYQKYASVFQDATTFDLESARRWGRAYRLYLRDWLPRQPDAHLVDIACGGGRLLQMYKDLGYAAITGVDVSAEQVAIASHTGAVVRNEEGGSFLLRHQGQFDLISAIDVIEHLQKQEVLGFLDACMGALKPGGSLVIQTPNADSPWGGALRYGDFTHEISFNPKSLGALLKLASFTDIEFREQGPLALGYSAISTIRWVCWQGIRIFLKAYNMVEIGSAGSNVFSRVMLCRARKPLV